MILGMGIDICPISRIEDVIDRQGELFTKRVFTQKERTHATKGKKVTGERLAARWAAKEAAIKALGAPHGLRWHDMEVANSPDGAPSLILRGAAKEHADRIGVEHVHISLSHAGGVSVAVVILEGRKK